MSNLHVCRLIWQLGHTHMRNERGEQKSELFPLPKIGKKEEEKSQETLIETDACDDDAHFCVRAYARVASLMTHVGRFRFDHGDSSKWVH